MKPAKNKGYILNLENHNQGGSHWVALYKGHYYDSYGVVPTKHISKFAKTYSTEQYQSLHQESCGYYAVYVLKNLFAGRDAYHDMIPGEFRHNENVLKNFFE